MNGVIDKTKELEQENVTAEASGTVGISDAAEAVPTPLPRLEYTEVRERRSAAPPKRKRRGIIALAVLAVFAVAVAVIFRLELLDYSKTLRMESATEIPEGAAVPAFVPIDPMEFMTAASDELIVVPDETGFALPAGGEAPSAVSLAPRNYYAQTPNVSEFCARASQDESYIYFMRYMPSEDKYALSDLMRMRISNGKTEPVPNAYETSGSIYSFALLGQNIITCEFKRDTEAYAFYRVPKSSEDAQLLFEQDSPALMNVYDDKLFLFFAETQKLGVFDIAADTSPAFVDMGLMDERARYLPEFSVINGYLYYGVSYYGEDGGGARTEYMRRSLYTGETVTVLASNGEDGSHILNPYWDEAGNAYYWLLDFNAGTYSLSAAKDGAAPELLNTFDFDGSHSPALILKDEYLVAAASPRTLCNYNRSGGFAIEVEAQIQNPIYAATKDFLIASDGVYRIFDLSFTPYVM